MRRADAIVNPKFLRVDDPLRTLPGVGVAYKLVQQLYELSGDPGERPNSSIWWRWELLPTWPSSGMTRATCSKLDWTGYAGQNGLV